MSIIEQISQKTNELTPNERRVVQTVIDSPTEAALGTASDLAASVGVHEATVSRLVKKLGYNNYAAFREALRNEFITTRETAQRFEKTIAKNETDTILRNLALQEVQALGHVERAISAEQINTVAIQLMKAERLFIYGQGNSEILSLMVSKRFRRFGKDVHQLSGDPRELAESVLGFKKGDVLLSFAFRRPPRGYSALIETAREAGVKTIVLSGSIGAMLTPQPDHLILTPRSGDTDAFQTLTVPMTVCNAIIIAAGLTAKETSLRKLEELGRLIERFE